MKLTRKITTNLPAPEAAFQEGVPTRTMSFADARRSGLSDEASPNAGVVMISQLLGENMLHLYSVRNQKNKSAEFIWDQHHQIDNELSKIFVALPPQLRILAGFRDRTTVHINMALFASIISLHQGTI